MTQTKRFMTTAGIALTALPAVFVQTSCQRANDAKPAAERAESKQPHKHTNLIRSKSPYLLQHAHNPVDWYEWSEEAFAKARKENKPIFLSVGYSTCHWCHVMERESFENEEVAKFMNEHFICIKVDREERPDVDRVYMTFVQATTGGGGWPMSVRLTPDLKPFFGGTYFPPDDKFGRRGFSSILTAISQSWAKDREKILASGSGDQKEITVRLSGLKPDSVYTLFAVSASDQLEGAMNTANGKKTVVAGERVFSS